MSERSERLKAAFAASGLSVSEAAALWGVKRDTLKSNLNGRASFSYAAAQRYAAHLGVTAPWLYAGEGEMRPLP